MSVCVIMWGGSFLLRYRSCRSPAMHVGLKKSGKCLYVSTKRISATHTVEVGCVFHDSHCRMILLVLLKVLLFVWVEVGIEGSCYILFYVLELIL